MTKTVYFIGVSTSGSRVHALFPRWMDTLGVDARIEGVDMPLGASAEQYRDIVLRIAHDPEVTGAVITTHKLGIYEAGRPLFAKSDRFVPLLREVNAIAKRGDKLVAFARDPLAAGATLGTMLGKDYWSRNEADVLCLGAGGAATAIALCLLTNPRNVSTAQPPSFVLPRRLLFVDIALRRLDALRGMVETVRPHACVQYLHHMDAEENDALLRDLPPGSLIINATGLGKDRPGSPITSRAEFPIRSILWDLNYRGSLEFLQHARMQEERRDLRVHDGWRYFLHGWTHTLSSVLNVDLTPAVFTDSSGGSPC